MDLLILVVAVGAEEHLMLHKVVVVLVVVVQILVGWVALAVMVLLELVEVVAEYFQEVVAPAA
jgi:hypothetical protein